MTQGTYVHTPYSPQVARLRSWRTALIFLLLMALVVGGGIGVLRTYGKRLKAKPVEPTAQHTHLKQSWAYEPERAAQQGVATPPEKDAEVLRQMAALQHELQQQREMLEALRRQKTTTVVKDSKEQAKPVSERKPPPGSMLFISHTPEPEPGPQAAEYTLAPGDTKIACQIETAMNSNVEGYFLAKVTTNVYDTATRRHLLIPQGSSILGNDQSRQLLYGDERMDTISLTLTLPDGRTVDLGKAPVTDQQGVAGLTGRVDQHYWRLFGAVFIGGALKGGMNAMQTAMTSAAGAGQITSGLTTYGTQATNQVVRPMLNTRPTIEVDAGQLCQVLLLKPLHLPAMWQQSEPREGARLTQAAARAPLPPSPRR
jgi:type IV secretory pathway VirB10-like protein